MLIIAEKPIENSFCCYGIYDCGRGHPWICKLATAVL